MKRAKDQAAYTGTALVRNPFFWLLVGASLYVSIFYQIARLPLVRAAGRGKPVFVVYLKEFRKDPVEILRLDDNRRVYVRGQYRHEIPPALAFQVMFWGSILAMYPNSYRERSQNVPVVAPDLLVFLKPGVVERNFRFRGYGKISQLRDTGGLSLVYKISDLIVNHPSIKEYPPNQRARRSRKKK